MTNKEIVEKIQYFDLGNAEWLNGKIEQITKVADFKKIKREDLLVVKETKDVRVGYVNKISVNYQACLFNELTSSKKPISMSVSIYDGDKWIDDNVTVSDSESDTIEIFSYIGGEKDIKKLIKDDEARKKQEEIDRRVAEEKRLEEDRVRAEEEKKNAELRAKQKEEQDKKDKEAMEEWNALKIRIAEEDKRRKEAEAKRLEEERIKREQEERQRRIEEEERKHREEMEAAAERMRLEEEERKRKEEEARLAREAEERRIAEEKRRQEEERLRREEEDRKRLEEEKRAEAERLEREKVEKERRSQMFMFSVGAWEDLNKKLNELVGLQECIKGLTSAMMNMFTCVQNFKDVFGNYYNETSDKMERITDEIKIVRNRIGDMQGKSVDVNDVIKQMPISFDEIKEMKDKLGELKTLVDKIDYRTTYHG